MEINDALMDKLANLARLKFNEAEKTAIKEDLEKIIRFVDKLNEIDTTGVEPLLHITDNINTWREDKVGEMCTAEESLRNATLKDDHFFKVPTVIKK